MKMIGFTAFFMLKLAVYFGIKTSLVIRNCKKRLKIEMVHD